MLGAGRLIDVNLEALRNSKSISLFDADPSCVSTWRRKLFGFKAKKEFLVEELTQTLDAWSKDLENLLSSNNPQDLKLISFLNSLKAPDVDLIGSPYDCIISVNLLSQIIVYWRDLAGGLIEKIRLGRS